MIIETLTLTNFRGVREMTLHFNARITVLVGVNGAGKSTVLDALAILLSWGAARISDPEHEGTKIPADDITNGTDYSFLGLELRHDEHDYAWSLLRRKPGFEVEAPETVRGESQFATSIRRRITETDARCSLPVMVLYPVGRTVRQVSPEPSRPNAEILEIYDGALSGQADFRAFFEWCREHDDIANEERSGQEWFIQNRSRIEEHADRLATLLATCLAEAGIETTELDTPRRKFLLHELRRAVKSQEYFEILYDFWAHAMPWAKSQSLQRLIQESYHLSSVMCDVDHAPRSMDRWASFVDWTLSGFLDIDNEDVHEPLPEIALLPFVRELLAFSLDWGGWWMSAAGRRRLQDIFRNQFPQAVQGRGAWHHECSALVERLRSVFANEAVQQGRNHNVASQKLNVVFHAVQTLVPEFTNLRISRKPSPRMLAQKDDETFDINQLSDGEKCLIAMVGDLARRLTMANPTMDNPLEGEGVVLVDEIDLHLHPTWQRTVVPRLLKTFPNVQFILSTHSPQVLSHVEDKSVFLLNQTADSGIVHVPLTEAYGQTYERLLEDVFGIPTRPDEIQHELELLFDLIQKNNVAEAREKFLELRRRIGADPDLTRADFLLHRKEETAR